MTRCLSRYSRMQSLDNQKSGWGGKVEVVTSLTRRDDRRKKSQYCGAALIIGKWSLKGWETAHSCNKLGFLSFR